MKVIFLDIDGTLTTTKSGKVFKQHPFHEDIKVIEGVPQGLQSFLLRGYELIGISNQGGIPRFKSALDTVLEMQETMRLLPGMKCIYFTPDDGEEVYKVALEGFEYSRRGNQDNFRKPSPGMIQKALEEYGRLDDIWMIGDLLCDEQCAAIAKINYLPANIWHMVLKDAMYEVNCVTQLQVDFMRGVKTPF